MATHPVDDPVPSDVYAQALRVTAAARELRLHAAGTADGRDLPGVLGALAEACEALEGAAGMLAGTRIEVTGLRRGTPADELAGRRVEAAIGDVAARLRDARDACQAAGDACEARLGGAWSARRW